MNCLLFCYVRLKALINITFDRLRYTKSCVNSILVSEKTPSTLMYSTPFSYDFVDKFTAIWLAYRTSIYIEGHVQKCNILARACQIAKSVSAHDIRNFSPLSHNHNEAVLYYFLSINNGILFSIYSEKHPFNFESK